MIVVILFCGAESYCILEFYDSIKSLANSLSQRENGKRDNPALEPMIEYSNEETKNSNNRHDFTATATDTEPKVKTFTDFILETINILNTYEDTAFQDFFHILDIEMRKYHYEGCKFSELMQNHNIRKLLEKTLKTIRENTIISTKTNINVMADMMRVEIYDHNLKEFLDYINSLYFNKESEFHRFLNNLKRFKKTQPMETFTDLEQVIRDGVRTILFSHYTELDTYTRRELKDNIETFWERLEKGPASNAEIINHVINKTDPVRSVMNNVKISKYVKNNNKAPVLSTDRKKKIKTLGINRNTYDQIDFLPYSRHETDNSLTPKLKREPPARVASDKRRHAVNTPTDLISSNDAFMATLQSATNDLLKSLSKLANTPIFGRHIKSNTTLYQKSARHSNVEPTINKIPAPFMQAQEEIGSQKPIAVTNLPIEKLCPTKQPNERRRSNTKVKHFNEFINLKIKTIQNELNELKQVNDDITRLANNATDEVDDDEIKENEQLKTMQEKIIKMMNSIRVLNGEEVSNGNIYNPKSNAVKTLSTTNTNTIAEVVHRAMDIVNGATSQTTDNDVNIIKTDTEELNKAISTDRVTSSSTVAERIIRHKNPFDHIDMKFLSRTL